MSAGLRGLLTLISAPAGSGKTTLMSAWRADPGRQIPAARYALDAGDNDLFRFLNYLVAALDAIRAGLAGNALLLLQPPSFHP